MSVCTEIGGGGGGGVQVVFSVLSNAYPEKKDNESVQ